MKKSTFFIASVLSVLAISSVNAGEQLKTKFGDISINDENMLLINGKKFDPKVEGDFALSIEGNFNFGSGLAVLLMNNSGGTACPVQYRWLMLDKLEAKVSPQFGNCSDLAKPVIKAGKLVIELPAKGKRKDVYTFDGQVVQENGKPVK